MAIQCLRASLPHTCGQRCPSTFVQRLPHVALITMRRRHTFVAASDGIGSGNQENKSTSQVSFGSSTRISPGQPRGGRGGGVTGVLQQLADRFDSLPQKQQAAVMTGLLVVCFVVGPFLQPTTLYGDSSSKPSTPLSRDSTATVCVSERETAAATAAGGLVGSQASGGSTRRRHKQQQEAALAPSMPVAEPKQSTQHGPILVWGRYVPGISDMLGFLQESAMPQTLPNGRTESPGVMRIYLASMIILGLFYACSAVVGAVTRLVVSMLRAVGILGPPAPASDETGLPEEPSRP